jgi:hypothetical protein
MGDVQLLKLMGMTAFRMTHPSNRMTPFGSSKSSCEDLKGIGEFQWCLMTVNCGTEHYGNWNSLDFTV